jgi:hypothetical protein
VTLPSSKSSPGSYELRRSLNSNRCSHGRCRTWASSSGLPLLPPQQPRPLQHPCRASHSEPPPIPQLALLDPAMEDESGWVEVEDKISFVYSLGGAAAMLLWCLRFFIDQAAVCCSSCAYSPPSERLTLRDLSL